MDNDQILNKINFAQQLLSPQKKQLSSHFVQKITSLQQVQQQLTFEQILKSKPRFCVSSKSVESIAGIDQLNQQKTNQDSFIDIEQFLNIEHCHLFGVCDGHGDEGQKVSKFIKKSLPKNIDINLIKYPNKQVIIESFEQTNQELLNSDIDCEYSGSTTIICLLINDYIITANLGDSRAILGQNKINRWCFQELSKDQKPDNQNEKQRILKAGGRVEQMKDKSCKYIGPYRVWHKHQQFPGLAMSRSFGDESGAQVGVIHIPEIKIDKVSISDKFIIICSDGVFEFLENQNVLDLTTPFYQKNQSELACQCVTQESIKKWRKQNSVVDDITAILVFLRQI